MACRARLPRMHHRKADMRSAKAMVPAIVVVAVIFSSYSNTFYSPLVLDDFHSFVFEKSVHLNELSSSNLISLSKTVFGWKRWIPMMTFALDFYWGDGDLFFFHLSNLCIHLLCTAAVAVLIFKLLQVAEEQKGLKYPFPPFYFALWVAGLWAANPIQTNAVTYLVQRMASIQTFFFVSSVCCYLIGRRRHLSSGRLSLAVLVAYAGCLLNSICAFFSKENSAVLPALLVATEWWFFTPDLWRKIRLHLNAANRVSRWVLVTGVLVVSIFLLQAFEDVTVDYARRHFGLRERLLTESRIVVRYISLLLFPLPSRLSIEHDVQVSTSFFSPPTTFLSLCVLILALFLTLRFRNRYPLMTYGSMWFFSNLSIESTFIPLELVFEHRLYLPSIGLTLCVVIGIACIGRCYLPKVSTEDFTKLSWSIAALLLSTLALLTFQRNQAWESFISINEDAVAKAPRNPRAHANLAVAYGRAGMNYEALQQAEEALKLGRPHHEDYMVASNVIVSSLIALGETEKAFVRGEELLADFPKDYDAGALPYFCLNMAQGHLDQLQIKEAYSFAQCALDFASRLDRNDHELHLVEGMMLKLLAIAEQNKLDLDGDGSTDPGVLPRRTWVARRFLSVGERRQAALLLRETLADNPVHPESIELLTAIGKTEQLDEAQKQREDYRRKYLHRPYPVFNFYLAVAYLICDRKLQGPMKKLGMSLLNRAQQIHPDNPDPYLLTGWYHYANGDVQAAIESAQSALKLDPDYAKAWLGLGFFLIQANQFADAIDSFQKALDLYPGYPKKRVLVRIISDLKKGATSPFFRI